MDEIIKKIKYIIKIRRKRGCMIHNHKYKIGQNKTYQDYGVPMYHTKGKWG